MRVAVVQIGHLQAMALSFSNDPEHERSWNSLMDGPAGENGSDSITAVNGLPD